MRGDRAARLGDDVRVRDAVGVADLLDREDDVVRVLLHRVVHRRREVGLRAVVVDAEAAADVEVRQALRAELVQLDEQPAGLAQRVLDALDRGDLRAEVEVEQLERVDLVPRLELVDRLDHLGRGQAELREVAARLLPAARAARRQPRADAERRLDLHALADAVDLIELGRLLDDEDHRLAQLRREQRGLDVLLVLVAVADDERLVVLVDRHDREELGLAAGLEAVVERPAELDDLLDDGAVLVDLDRVHAAVLPAVAVLA